MSDATYRFPYAYPLFTKRRILTNTNRSEMGGVWYEDCIYYWWFKFLNKHHKAKRGRAEIKDRLTAKYTPTNDRVSALKKLHRFMEMKKKLPYDSNKTVWYECERIDKSFVVKSNEDYATGDRVKQYENIRSYASRYAVKGNKLLDKIEKGVF